MRRSLRTKCAPTLTCALLLLLVLPHAAAGRQQDKAAKIREVLALAHKYGQFNGSALVADGGGVLLKDGFGMANMEWKIPNTPDTRFRLGSITKQFTAALTLRLVEQGKLKLDGKISDYLPDYRKDVGGRVTVHHLLTHTSGIPSYTGLPGFMQEATRDPYRVADFVRKYASRDLEFEPGSKYSYNNSGYFLLGAIIERVTGKSYEQALREQILDPLGMKNTGYDRHDTIIERRAAGYVKTPAGYRNAPYLDMSIPYAAGSMYSTVEDLYLWDQALYGDRVLSAASRELMFKPFLEKYAYGWVVTDASYQADGRPVQVVMHGGGINGFNTVIVRYVGRKGLVVLLDNTSQGMYIERMSEAIGRILHDQPYDMPKMSLADALMPTITAEGLAAGVSRYRELRAGGDKTYDFSEGELNRLGYQLLRAGRVKDAVEIFKLNVEAYPLAFNTYDSLAEAYMAAGERELSEQNYRKSLELNPKNTNAAEMLKRLEGAAAPADTKVYDSYVGEYEVAPGFAISVTREGGRLMTQATGQSKVEVFPESETTFFLRVVNAKITFVKNAEGQVTGLVIHQGGRDTPAKKVR